MTRSKDQISEELIAKAKQFAKMSSPKISEGVTIYDHSSSYLRVLLVTSEPDGKADKRFCMVIDSRKDGQRKLIKLTRCPNEPDHWTGCTKDCSSIIEHAFALSSPAAPSRKARPSASDTPKAP